MVNSNQKSKEFENEKSFKEKRVRDITFIYYSRSDVKTALFNFAKNRECIPRFYEGFGKRPDSFQYEGDISEYVRRGATSFHCSEEIWQDPLEISTEMNRKEFDELRIGWDLLLDIDSPYLEYSKIFADLIVRALKERHKIKNVGVKFSGSKGFHIIVPWNAFPKEIYGKKTREMFPEWPRAICSYLSEVIKPKLIELMFENQSLKEVAKLSGKNEEDLIITECLSCKRPSTKKYLVTWICENCNQIGDLVRLETNKRIPKCPECRNPLIEQKRDAIFFCDFCDIRSDKNPEMFAKTREKTEILIDADLILVAPRHLFRMPYSLHEKTALASIVIDSDKIKDFQINDAKPLKVNIQEFYPDAKEGEAKDLLLQALDWYERKEKDENQIKEKKEFVVHSDKKPKKTSDFQKIIIEEPLENIFPPHIKNILKGIGQDGRKRALFILMSFFTSLGAKENYIEKTINDWNDKNYLPLKKGYIQSQFSWYRRNSNRLPPNFDNSIYKELGIEGIDDLVKQTKNPVSYAVKKWFITGGRS
jgi:DNA primase catalytic subunit